MRERYPLLCYQFYFETSMNTDFTFTVTVVYTSTSLKPTTLAAKQYWYTINPIPLLVAYAAVPACWVPSIFINTDCPSTFKAAEGLILIEAPTALVIQSQDLSLIGQ